MGRRLFDMGGKTFGRLKVIKRDTKHKGEARWLCQCACGNIKTIRGAHLRSGFVKSCGCLHSQATRERRTTHGYSDTRPYFIWHHMLRRCLDANDPAYRYYGGRGIAVCDKWRTFEDFWEDMQDGYSDDLTIDRINNNKGYSKENCRWATAKEQNLNKRNNMLLTYNGQTKAASEWASEVGLNAANIRSRINSGWSTQNALTMPPIGKSILRTINGETKNLKQWAETVQMPYTTLIGKLNRGFSLEGIVLGDRDIDEEYICYSHRPKAGVSDGVL